MKKCLLILLALTLALFSLAYAESQSRIPDFSQLDDNELLASFYLLQAEALKRGIDLPYPTIEATSSTLEPLSAPMALSEGKYVIGQTIPAGTYSIACTKTESDGLSDMMNSYGNIMKSLGDEEGEAYSNLFSAYGNLYNALDNGMHISVLGEYGDVIESFYLKSGDERVVVLKEGTALEIASGECTITSK